MLKGRQQTNQRQNKNKQNSDFESQHQEAKSMCKYEYNTFLWANLVLCIKINNTYFILSYCIHIDMVKKVPHNLIVDNYS